VTFIPTLLLRQLLDEDGPRTPEGPRYDHGLLLRFSASEDELIASGAVRPPAHTPAQLVPHAEFDRRLFARLDRCEVRLRMLGAEVRHAA